jgi:hypothetical protein
MTFFWDDVPCSLVDIYRHFIGAYITLMMAVLSSETSVSIYHTTRCNIPEDIHLHIRRRENLKSHTIHLDCCYILCTREIEMVYLRTRAL